MSRLEVLPTRTGGAAENMALDFLLLQRYPGAERPRFRHYEWRGPAFTFGYGQKIAWVRGAIPAEEGVVFDLCRRPTGGGIVDHREDWTYALVIPRGHPLEDMRASASYGIVHACLAEALGAQGVPALLKRAEDAAEALDGAEPGVCFQKAEVADVVNAETGAKIAGAAQKRNKRGLLFQGSVWRPATGIAVDWDALQDDFTARLGRALEAAAEPTPWPDLDEDEVAGLIDQYGSPEWIERR